MTSEKRKLIRYLCDDSFSDSQLNINDKVLTLVSVNFNHRGIAIYSHLRLPVVENCHISFQYQREQQNFEIDLLQCTICHRFETDTGHQYGIEFVSQEKIPLDLQQKLMTIENFLKNNNPQSDRYGLFGK